MVCIFFEISGRERLCQKSLVRLIVVENVKAMADGGMDIGGVMIGMHIHNKDM